MRRCLRIYDESIDLPMSESAPDLFGAPRE